MDGKNSIYYEKYLKYKNKYLALKNKIGGNGNIHNRPCNTSIGYNQFYYNIYLPLSFEFRRNFCVFLNMHFPTGYDLS